MKQPDYIESREGGYRIRGTGVSLDSVVYRFLEGLSPETIQADCFPALTLDQMFRAYAEAQSLFFSTSPGVYAWENGIQ